MNCQIIYVLGVEGSAHHGIKPVIEALARQQISPETGFHYRVKIAPEPLRYALFGTDEKRTIDDPSLVDEVMSIECPNDGFKDVIIQGASFPSGYPEQPNFRVSRQDEWSQLTMEEIASSETALNHPTNLYRMTAAYSKYAEIKFVVLHRNFLQTIASHSHWDHGIEGHSNVIRGFMLLISRFLKNHPVDVKTGRKMWTLVCTDNLESKFHEDSTQVEEVRQRVLTHLTDFLSWEDGNCPHCFDSWVDSSKDWRNYIRDPKFEILKKHMKELDGIWPPKNDIPEQQCSLQNDMDTAISR